MSEFGLFGLCPAILWDDDVPMIFEHLSRVNTQGNKAMEIVLASVCYGLGVIYYGWMLLEKVVRKQKAR
jgi:hypothetical protein